MKLFGTITSPYVRRIRFLLQEANQTFTLIDTSQEAGQKELRSKSPLWKIPFLEVDSSLGLWDSRIISEYILKTWNPKSFRRIKESEEIRENCMIEAVDTALDSAIQLFYMNKEGATPALYPYLQKQKDRVDSILHWIGKELNEPFWSSHDTMGLSELALFTTFDWMRFRNVTEKIAMENIQKFLKHWENLPNLQNTKPF